MFRIASIAQYALLGVITAGAASFSIGCKGQDNVMAPNTTADDPLSAAAYPNIVLLDGLERALVKEGAGIVPPAPGDAPGTPMHVRVTVRSVVDHQTSIEYRVMFFGPNDEPLTRNPVWRGQVVQARTRIVLQANAMVAGAARYEMEIRKAR